MTTDQKEATHHCENVTVERHEETAEVEIKAEISTDVLKKHRPAALKKLAQAVKVDGFRDGKVPEDVLIKNVGEEAILREMADMTLTEELPLLLASENILAIAAPAVTITKFAPDNPLGFTARVQLYPTVELGDYQNIAREKSAEKKEVTVEESEVEDTLTHLRRERAKVEKIEGGMDPTQAHEEASKMETLELPGIDDTFVQSLGYKDAEDFKVKLRENIKNEKELHEKEKVRVAIIEGVLAASTIPAPAVMIEHELDKMEAQMKADIERAGTTFDAYLTQVGKTREALRAEWNDVAKKRAQTQLMLAEIAKKENIEADEEQLKQFIEHTKKQQPDAPETHVRAHFGQMLRNEAVLNFLESQSEKADQS